MANYKVLKEAVKRVIKSNGKQEITGDILQNILLKFIDTFGEDYEVNGMAQPSDTPSTAGKCIYFASTAGIYANFGNINVASGEVVALIYDGNTWTKQQIIDTTGFVSADYLTEYDVSANNGGASYTLQEAINAVPARYRKGGLTVKFIDNATSEYAAYYNKTGAWTTDATKWANLLAGGEVITLDDLNTFPTAPQQAIDLVKKGGNAYYTLVDGGKTVGVVNIYADVQRQVLTEVVETRLTLQNDRFTRGHFYEAPRKYWRNYGLQRDFAGGFIKKHEWTKWHVWASTRFEFHEEYIKQMAQVFDGSPDNQAHTLDYVLNAVNTNFSQWHKDKCLFVSFISEDKQERVLYQCKKGVFSTTESDWVRLISEDEALTGEQKPFAVPFADFVENAIVQLSSTISGDVVWGTAKKVFLCRVGGKYYSSWGNVANYGEVTADGVKPRSGVIFFQISTGKCYTWESGEFTQLSNGWSAEITDYAKRKIDEAVEAAKKIKKGEDGKDGRIALVNHGTNDTTFALTPNVMHVWGEVERLRLTLAPNTEPNIRAEYDFQFTTPANKATDFQLQGVQWQGEVVPTILKGKTYQGMVVNGFAVLIGN